MTNAITKMSWWEIPVPDLDDAKRFYGEVFGWTFDPFGEDYFAVIGPDGNMLGGISWLPKTSSETACASPSTPMTSKARWIG